nr:variable surface lipoprotein [Mycoplasmopsis bovis]
MKRKLMLIGGGLIFASSFPMIATSCGVKKKDVETSNSKNQDSKPNSESKCRKSRFKKQTHNLNQKIKIQNPTQNLNQKIKIQKPNSQSKCRKSRFRN